MSQIIQQDALRDLVADWLKAGKKAAGPVQIKAGEIFYAPLVDADQIVFDGYIRPANSIKEFVFPRHETLYRYRVEGKKIDVIDAPLPDTEQLIIGARPCDTASLPILDHVMNWDFKDSFFNKRRELTTIVTIACTDMDEECFCTSVGLGPQAEKGSDALLLDLGDGSYEVRALTDKGRKLFDGQTQASDKKAPAFEGPEKKFDPATIKAFVEEEFDNPLWEEMTLRCLGCGACAFTCPTCHCFDIVDEGNSAAGARVRNWDTCQAANFTAHASGHNPRTKQPQRQRQRMYHKFSIYPEKFGEILCTGCGNCLRNCPAGLGVLNVAKAIEKARAEGTVIPVNIKENTEEDDG